MAEPAEQAGQAEPQPAQTRESAIRRATRSTIFRLLLGICAGGFFLYLAFRNVSLAQVGRTLSTADPAWVGLALISTLASVGLKTIRWRVLLGQPGRGISFYLLSMGLAAGQLMNWIVPARLGDFSRAYAIGGLGPGRAFAFGTVVLEKILDLAFYGLLFIGLFLLLPLPDWINTSAYVVFALAVSAILVTILLVFQRRRLKSLYGWLGAHLPSKAMSFLEIRLAPQVRSGLDSLGVFQKPVELIKVIFWTCLIWASMILTNQLTLLALDIHLPLSASVFVLIALQASISIPNIPGTMGLFEYTCVLALSIFGVSQPVALSYGILLHAIVFLPILIIGLVSIPVLGLKK